MKIINANLKFLVKVPVEKAKYNLSKNLIYAANLKSFSNQRSDSASKLSSSKALLPF